jgi:hypothetical protein
VKSNPQMIISRNIHADLSRECQALELGYRGAFLCEHYGSDAITVIGKNRAYIRDILATLID